MTKLRICIPGDVLWLPSTVGVAKKAGALPVFGSNAWPTISLKSLMSLAESREKEELPAITELRSIITSFSPKDSATVEVDVTRLPYHSL